MARRGATAPLADRLLVLVAFGLVLIMVCIQPSEARKRNKKGKNDKPVSISCKRLMPGMDRMSLGVNITTLESEPAAQLEANAIGHVVLALQSTKHC